MDENVNPVDEEVIDMVEEPGSNTWSTSNAQTPPADFGETAPLFGSIPGIGGGKSKIPLIIGLIVLALLLCCVLNSCSGCSNLLGGSGGLGGLGGLGTGANSGGLLGGLLGGNNNQNQAASTEYQARLDQEVTLGGVTFLLESGVQYDPNFGRDVEAYRATIHNNTSSSITIMNDGGWSAIDASGNYLEYNWDSEAVGQANTDQGVIGAGSTYVITLVFTDASGNPTQPSAIKADFKPALEGYRSIAWTN